MDKNWSEMNKEMQALIAKKATFRDGIEKLLALRQSLFEQITQIVTTFPEEAFSKMPFAGAEGYHSKTLAYSIWHIFRIEDIVAHEMIAKDQQVLFSQDFLAAIHSPIITTGNELAGDGIAEFSKQLNIQALYRYAREVMRSTDHILTSLEYPDLKRKFGEDTIEKLRRTGCVSETESACWLIDYWCGKDVQGLIRMPFSRHWIMHIEAMQRIKNRLCMDNYVTGAVIKSLRETKGLTQEELAERIHVSAKAVSKWETGKGFPDISLLEPLAEALGISVIELLSGCTIRNRNKAANMLRSRLYVCPACGNVIQTTGETVVSCCGITLPPQEAEKADDEHAIRFETVEDEYFVSVAHPMTKPHFLSFLMAVSDQGTQFVRLYPEGAAKARFKVSGVKILYAYCNRHGLFQHRIKREKKEGLP